MLRFPKIIISLLLLSFLTGSFCFSCAANAQELAHSDAAVINADSHCHFASQETTSTSAATFRASTASAQCLMTMTQTAWRRADQQKTVSFLERFTEPAATIVPIQDSFLEQSHADALSPTTPFPPPAQKSIEAIVKLE
ncbi:MAG: hypothetical protein V1778_01760 [bacterium]